jgi:hypothetical protein
VASHIFQACPVSPIATVYDSYNNLVVVRSVLLFCGFILT